MTSLRGSLPPAGSTLWQKERRSSSLDSSTTSSSLITHIVIREVWKKTIPSPHALYKIDVMTKSNHWYVLKRYREFSKLHKMLVSAYGIPKDMLPPKKITSKLSLKHLERRRDALEHYLQRLVNSSTYVSSSPEVLDFLDVNSHDVNAVAKALAKDLLKDGESILSEGGSYTFSLTQLYCISKQLQLPEPTAGNDDHSPLDLGHLYSFVYQLEELCVVPDKCQGSQGMMGHLEFDISLFKALRSLKIDRSPVYLIKSLDLLQPQLKYLAVRHSLKTMGELLVDKVIGKRKQLASSGSSADTWRNQATAKLTKNRVILQPWIQLTNLTLSHNSISMFDESLKLMPALQNLDLRYNSFVVLDFQQMNCPSLTHLDISHNSISRITGNCKNVPNLKSLILSHNKLDNLIAFHNMTSLIEIDLAYNNLGTLKELRNLSNMSQLRYLSVDGNALTKVKSYRVQIFSLFCGRKIILDNKPQTSSDNGSGSVWSRSRSFSMPDSVTRDDDDDIVRLVRANSNALQSMDNYNDLNIDDSVVDDDDDDGDDGDDDGDDDDDDGDSGIEAITSFNTDVATDQEEELQFNWSYFNFLDTRIGNPGMSTSREEPCLLEEQIREDMCEEKQLEMTSSTELADEVTVNEDCNINNVCGQEENQNTSNGNVEPFGTLLPNRTESNGFSHEDCGNINSSHSQEYDQSIFGDSLSNPTEPTSEDSNVNIYDTCNTSSKEHLSQDEVAYEDSNVNIDDSHTQKIVNDVQTPQSFTPFPTGTEHVTVSPDVISNEPSDVNIFDDTSTQAILDNIDVVAAASSTPITKESIGISDDDGDKEEDNDNEAKKGKSEMEQKMLEFD